MKTSDKNNKHIFYFILLVLTVLAAIIRFKWLTHHGIWMDEGYTITYSLPDKSIAKVIWGSVVRNSFPPVDFLLHHFIMRLFGVTEWSVKILPAITGISSVFFLGLLGKRLANWRVGIIAALLLALSPFHIYFSLEVRPYAHICFAAIIYTYAFVRYMQKSNIVNACFLALTLIYGYCVTIFFLFISAIVASSFVLSYIFTKQYRLSIFKSCIVHLTCAFPVYFIYSKIGLIERLVSRTSQTQPKLVSITSTLHSILSSFFYGKSYLANTNWFYYLLGSLWIIMVFYKIRKNWQLKVLCNMFLIAIPIIAWLFSIKGAGFAFLPRYIIYALPFIILGLSYGIDGLTNWFLFIISGKRQYSIQRFSLIFSVFTALSLFYFISFKPLKSIYTRVYKSPYRTIEERLSDVARRNPIIVISTVKYGLGGSIYFNHFYNITNACYKTYCTGNSSVEPKKLLPFIHDIVFENAKVIYIVNKGKWNVDRTLFELWNPNKGYPAIDVWIQKDLPGVISESMMKRYFIYFGQEFRKLRQFNVHEFLENDSNITRDLSIRMTDIPNLITSNLFKGLTRNVDCRGQKVKIANSIVDNILGTWPPTSGWGGVAYYTSNNFTRFRTSVLNISGEAILLIKGDGKTIARVGRKDASKVPVDIDLNITGINKLELLVHGFGYNNNDNPAWINPALTPVIDYTFVTDLNNIITTNLHVPLAFNKTWAGKYVFVCNTLYKKPVLVHPPLNGVAHIEIPLNSNYVKFISHIGILKEGGSARCKVYVDSKLYYDSGILTNSVNTEFTGLDVSDARELVLTFDACGDNFLDQVALLDPVLVKKHTSIIIHKNKKKAHVLQEKKEIDSKHEKRSAKYTSLLDLDPITNYVNYKVDSISVDNISYSNVMIVKPVSNTANAVLKYKLSKKYKRFQTTIWNANKRSTVLFFVKGDGKKIFNTGIFKGNMPPKQIDIDISCINILELYVHPFGYYPDDKIVIVNPKLIN